MLVVLTSVGFGKRRWQDKFQSEKKRKPTKPTEFAIRVLASPGKTTTCLQIYFKKKAAGQRHNLSLGLCLLCSEYLMSSFSFAHRQKEAIGAEVSCSLNAERSTFDFFFVKRLMCEAGFSFV